MNPLIDGIKERMNNSASGPFSLIYLIYNWKVVLYAITGNEDSSTRVANIEKYYKADFWCSFLGPILFLIAYLILMPIVVAGIDYWNKRVEVKKLNKIEENTLKESKLWSDSFKIIKELSGKIHLALNYIQNPNAADKNLEITKVRKYLEIIDQESPEKIMKKYIQFQIDK